MRPLHAIFEASLLHITSALSRKAAAKGAESGLRHRGGALLTTVARMTAKACGGC